MILFNSIEKKRSTEVFSPKEGRTFIEIIKATIIKSKAALLNMTCVQTAQHPIE